MTALRTQYSSPAIVDIKNTNEDKATGDTDDVPSITEPESNGIQHPDYVHPARQDSIITANAEDHSRFVTFVDGAHSKDYTRLRERTEGDEAPFVARGSVCGGRVAENTKPGDGNVPDDGCP